MTPAARISASIEVLADIETRHRPAADALKDWGLSHRFAGSGDRAAIAGLAYDALRRKASTAFLMQDAGARANVIGMLRLQRDLSPDQISVLFDGSRFAPAPLSDAEQHALAQGSLDRRAAARARRLSGMARPVSRPHVRRRAGGGGRRAGAARAARSARQRTRCRSRQSRGRARAPRDHADTLVAARPAAHAGAGRQKPGDPVRAGVPQGHDRSPGRRLAGRGPADRRRAGRAGGRPLRRRRRQDLGARRHDGEPRPDLRDRSRQAPPGADPCPARARERPRRPGPHPARRRAARPIRSPICAAASISW